MSILTEKLNKELPILNTIGKVVPVSKRKNPYMGQWQTKTLTEDEIRQEINKGSCKALGLQLGEVSDGLFCLDLDGESAIAEASKRGIDFAIPAVESGRPGRVKLFYKIPEKYWSQIEGNPEKEVTLRHPEEVKKDEAIEYLWHNRQAVIIGHHPDTDGYYYRQDTLGRHDFENMKLVEPPQWVLDYLMSTAKSKQEAKPIPSKNSPKATVEKVKAVLARLDNSHLNDYDKWWEVTACLKYEALCIEGTPEAKEIFELWSNWSEQSPKFDYSANLKTWDSAERVGDDTVKLGTLIKHVGGIKAIKSDFSDEIQAVFTKVTTKKAIIKDAYENLGERLRYNEVYTQWELDGEPINEADLNVLVSEEMVGQNLSDSDLRERRLAHKLSHSYKPITEEIQALYDNTTLTTAEAEKVIVDYVRDEMGIEKATEHMIMRRWFATLVNRILNPGCYTRNILILQGKQNIGKTTFFQYLIGHDNFISHKGKLDIEAKRIFHAKTLIEMGEFGLMMRGDDKLDSLKQFVTETEDAYRVMYSESIATHKRSFLPVGTVNDPEILKDQTGDTRFLPCSVTKKIDVVALRDKHRSRLLEAGAALLKNEGEQYTFLNDEEYTALEGHQERFALITKEDEMVLDWFENMGSSYQPMTLSEIAFEVAGHEILNHTDSKRLEYKISKNLRSKYGWESKRGTHPKSGKRLRLWFAPDNFWSRFTLQQENIEEVEQVTLTKEQELEKLLREKFGLDAAKVNKVMEVIEEKEEVEETHAPSILTEVYAAKEKEELSHIDSPNQSKTKTKTEKPVMKNEQNQTPLTLADMLKLRREANRTSCVEQFFESRTKRRLVTATVKY